VTKNFPHIIPDIEKWPINQLSKNRGTLVKEMIDYTSQKLSNGKTTEELAGLLASTIYLEKIRVKTNPWKVDPANEAQYWKKLESELKQNIDKDDAGDLHRTMLRKIINRYSEEIAGNFSPKTFRFARKLLTFFFKRIYNKGKEAGSLRPWGNKEKVAEKIKFYGYIDEVRSLFEKGTVVIVPNHFSNLDSILMGFAIDTKVGIPAFSYGAGLNLYDQELVAYYINRLGAYKLDRRKKNPIYLATLKSFSTLSIQKGVNTIFYPGGTRSRSGEFEKYIKLGLFGTMMEAQRNLCQKGSDSKIFVVPMTVGYHFVFEAKSLIQQHLSKEGKEQFISDKKSGEGLRGALGLLRRMWRKESEVIFNFGQPMDVFGNRVDATGVSYDARNRSLNILDYFKAGGELTTDEQREMRYTNNLGQQILASFSKENIILESHLLAFVAFQYFKRQFPKLDLYSFLRIPLSELQIEEAEFKSLIAKAKSLVIDKEVAGQLICSDSFTLQTDDFITRGLAYLGSYHKLRPLKLNKTVFQTDDLKLLYYYHNHLVGYQFETVFENQQESIVKSA